MKRQITVTVEGEAMVGKSSVAFAIERALTALRVEVINQDDAKRSGTMMDSTMELVEEKPVVTIRTRLLLKTSGMPDSGELSDEVLLTKVKEVRDYVNGLTEFAGQTRAHGETTATLDEVVDELEDRLAKRVHLREQMLNRRV